MAIAAVANDCNVNMTLKDIIANSKLSPIQLAKGIKSLKSITESHAQFETFKKEFIPADQRERISQIISGLEQEDEFAILCRLMGTCQSLVGIDQTPFLVNNDERPPDFLATFTPRYHAEDGRTPLTYKCFIEVKSSRNQTFKISKKDFYQRVNFASRYKLPLVFAVRLMSKWGAALWVVVESQYLESNRHRLDVSAINKGIRHLIFDEYFLMPLPGLHIAHYYDSKSTELGIKHPTYGTQVRTVLLLKDFLYEVPKENTFFLSAIFDSFQPEELQTKTQGNITVQILRPGLQARSLCDMLYIINRMAIDEQGDRLFDPSRLASRFDSKVGQPRFFTRGMIEHFTSLEVNSKPLFFSLGFEEPNEAVGRLKKLCSATN